VNFKVIPDETIMLSAAKMTSNLEVNINRLIEFIKGDVLIGLMGLFY
jgi:hypothetical protein